MHCTLPFLFAALLPACATFAQTTTIQLAPSLDNTLYESATGALSNGAGQYLFVGKTAQGAVRRALIAFDVLAAIPPKSRIVDVELRLVSSRSTASGPIPVELHRVVTQWGEGTSIGSSGEGSGAPATAGDATWTHGVFPSLAWQNVGGDFVGAPSSVTSMPVLGAFTFTKTVELIADVQDWLDGRHANHGWLLKTDEVASNTSRRLDSGDNTEPTGVVPQLTVTFLPPGTAQSFGTGCSTSGNMPFTQTIGGQVAQGQTATLTLTSGVPLGLYVTLLSYDVLPEPNQIDVGCYWWLRQMPFPNLGIRFHDTTGTSTETISIPFSTALFGLPLAMQSILVDFAEPRQYALSNAHLVCIG